MVPRFGDRGRRRDGWMDWITLSNRTARPLHLDERQFHDRLTWSILLDLWAAAGAFVGFMVVVDGPPEYEAFTQPSLWWAAYLGGAPVPIALWLRRRMQRETRSANGSVGAARMLTVTMPLLVTAYVAGAACVVVWDAGFVGANLTPGVLFFVVAVALTFTAYSGIPLFLVLQTLVGRYFGPAMPPRVLVPAIAGMLLLALGITFVGATSFVLYESVAHGALPRDALIIWVLLIVYAGIVCVLAYRHYFQSLQPIAGVMARLASPTVTDARPIIARSLDEIGAMAVQLNALLEHETRAQQELRDNQARLTMFAEAAGDYFYEMDENLRFSYFSDRFETITGIPIADVLGLTSAQMSQRFGVQNYDQHQGELEAHRPYRNYRFSTRRPDGRVLHLQVSAVPYFDEHGSFRGYRGTGTNITPFIEAQQTLRIREAELAQAQKMEAVGQLTGGIAHDFNNLLTVILGNLELLEVVCRDRVDLKSYVGAAVAATKRGGALTQRLLAFSRRQSLSPDSLDVGGLIENVSHLLRRTLGEDITLQVDIKSSPLWPCLIDRHQLENVILNLALNARDAMPKGGTLRFELSNHTLRERSLAGSAVAGDYVKLRVVDSGHGVAADVLPHVFEPFFTTKPPGEGSGLGLSMVYGFVRQSGGDVEIESKEGRGTTVSLLLPRASRSPTTNVRSAGAEGHGHTILVIEDDPGVGAVVTEALTGLGYHVVIASDGDDAIRRLESMPRIDLLLCDVVLPGSHSGIEVAALVCRRRPGTKVVFMSGYALDEIQRRSGVNVQMDILKKPFQLTELADHIASALAGE